MSPQPESRIKWTHLHKHGGGGFFLWLWMLRDGVDRAAGRMIVPNGDSLLFIYPESWVFPILHSGPCKEGIHPSTQNKCSFVFPLPCQWNIFSLHAGGKNELLKNFWTELHSVRDGDTGKKRQILKYMHSPRKFSKLWQKDLRQCIWCVTGKEWTFRMNQLLNKWLRALAVFSKDKNMGAHSWEHISFEELKPCITFFPINVKTIYNIHACFMI